MRTKTLSQGERKKNETMRKQFLTRDVCAHVATFLTPKEAASFANTCTWYAPQFWAAYYKASIKPNTNSDAKLVEAIEQNLGTGKAMVSALLQRCANCKKSTDMMLGSLRMCHKCVHAGELVAIAGRWLFKLMTFPDDAKCLDAIILAAPPFAKIVLPPTVWQRAAALFVMKPVWLQGCPGGTTIKMRETLVVRESTILENLDIQAGNGNGFSYMKPPDPTKAKPAVQMALFNATQVLEMRNCKVKSSWGTGVLLQKGSFVADNVHVHECAYSGVCLSATVGPVLPMPRMQNFVFEKIGGWAIQVADADYESRLHTHLIKAHTLVSDCLFFTKDKKNQLF